MTWKRQSSLSLETGGGVQGPELPATKGKESIDLGKQQMSCLRAQPTE
jgi:hypothetical protein